MVTKFIATVFSLFLFLPTAKANIDYMDVLPIFISHCANCHNSSSGNTNWLDPDTAITNKGIIYQRVFVEGDMPVYFRFFGGKDKQLLKAWLEQPEVKF